MSQSTVSMVMRDAPGPSAATRERVERVAAELGYRPDPAAQVLRQRRTRLLGVLFDAGDPYHADLLEWIYPAAADLGYTVVLSAVARTRDAATAVQALVASRCEGMLMLGPTADGDDVAALGRRLPVVVVGGRAPDGVVDTVRTAERIGVRQAVDHLVSLGHESIVHLDGGRVSGAAERRAGYRSAMRRHGLTARVEHGDGTEACGARVAAMLVETGWLPTAIVAFNDCSAIGALDALRRRGIDVPARVSVVGYDDSQLARLTHIDLTTVRQDQPRLAALAVRAAAERLDDGRDTPRDVRLEPRLIIRTTTAAPATAN